MLASGAQVATDIGAEETKKEMEKVVSKDVEAARYAQHSKRALAAMFEKVKGREGDSAADGPRIKLPEVAWHPSIARREQEKRRQDSIARESERAEKG